MENQTTFDKLDKGLRSFGSRFESGVMDWIRHDKVFDIFRSTSARLVLGLLTIGVLYGFPVAAFFADNLPLLSYSVALALCLGIQAISTRFVFNDREVIDEYQLTRRNDAYRRAFKQVGWLLGLLAVLCLAWIIDYENSMGSAWRWEINPYLAGFGLIWVVGLLTIQPYLSWGFKGEPRASHT